MPWTVDSPPNCAKNWTTSEKERCVAAANSVLAEGGKDAEANAIFACIRAAGKSVRKYNKNLVDLEKIYFVNGIPVTLGSLVRIWLEKRQFDPNVGGGVDRDKLKDSDFVFSDEREFPVMIASDVSDAVHSWGRYRGSHSFEDFKRRLKALCHRKGSGLVAALPKDWGEKKEEEKGTPTSRDIHIPGCADGHDPDDDEIGKCVNILKVDDAKHLIYGAVLIPNKTDTQGDRISEEEIEKAAHIYLANKLTRQLPAMDEDHEKDLPISDARPVESYILLQDLDLGEKKLPKGTWVVAAHLPNKDKWERVKNGEIRGFSIKGVGRRKRIIDNG